MKWEYDVHNPETPSINSQVNTIDIPTASV